MTTRRWVGIGRRVGVVLATAIVGVLVSPAYGVNPTFQTGTPVQLPSAALQIVPMNVDANGTVDAVAITNSGAMNGGVLRPLLGTGTGTFAVGTPVALGFVATMVSAGDVNSDGKGDVVVAGEAQRIIMIGGGEPDEIVSDWTVRAFLGNGAGGFVLAPGGVTVRGDFPSVQIATGDFTGEGRLDVAVVDATIDQFQLLVGNGAGGFATQPTTPVAGLHQIAALDVSGDGQLDVAFAGANGVAVMITGAFGQLGPLTTVDTAGVSGMTTGDVDRDGRLDLVLTSSAATANLRVLRNTGTGTFQSLVPVDAGFSPRTARDLADVNRDGRPDIVVANVSRTTLSILSGTVTGGLQGPIEVLFGSGTVLTVAPSDLDADGRPDLVVANGAGGVVPMLNTTTIPPPVVTTGAAGDITADAATLTGIVDTQGPAATHRFEYGTTTEYGRTSSPVAVGADSPALAVATSVTGLLPSTTYHYRLVATSAFGTGVGADGVFTTRDGPPLFTVKDTRVGVRWRASRLRGTLTVEGAALEPVNLAISLQRVGRPKPDFARAVNLASGAFTSSLRLPSGLRPGRYEVVLLATAKTGDQALRRRIVVLTPPAAGYVHNAFVSRQLGGRAEPRITGRRPKIIFATFQFLHRPVSLKRGVTVEWIDPSGRRATRPVRKRFLRDVSSFAGSLSGRALRPGRWRCVLKVGGVVVSQTSTVIAR